MEPHTRYVMTSDGVSIAYATSGAGPLLLSIPSPPDNHIGLEWEDADSRAGIEKWSSLRTLVRFDGRGTGLSDREISSYTLEDRLADAEAVVSRLGSEPLAIITGMHGCQVAVALAAAHPERVSQLVLVNPFAAGRDFTASPRIQAMERLLEFDWQLFTENVGALVFGFGSALAPRYGEFFRQCVSQQDAITIYRDMGKVDIGPLLPQIQVPTLVIAAPRFDRVDTARHVAAAIPNAELILQQSEPESYEDEVAGLAANFLGHEWPAAERTASAAAFGSLQIIVVTDLAGHTPVMQRVGDARGREILREHERLTRNALRAHGGTEVKTLGDGFIASFSSAQRALECAAALQRAVADSALLCEHQLQVRIGINAGEPVAEDDDLFGASVITASRIAAQAGGGEVLVANVVRELVAGKSFLFAERGPLVLKGFDEPTRVWQLHEG